MTYNQGTPKVGNKIPTNPDAPIEKTAANGERVWYELTFQVPRSIAWALPDWLLQSAVGAGMSAKGIDVFFFEVTDGGLVTVQGYPHLEATISIGGKEYPGEVSEAGLNGKMVVAIIGALAGVGLTVAFQGIWKVLPTPREILGFPGGGGEPGGAAGVPSGVLVGLLVAAALWWHFS